MIRKITLLFLVCFGLNYTSEAQLCGFDQRHQQLLAQDPAFAQKVAQMNSNLAAMIQSNSNNLIVNTPNGPVYEIPVVIHVIHTGGAVGSIYNPPNTQLIDMIDYLNQSYAATWPGYPNASNGGARIPLKFVLAKRTPSCAATNGIVRVDGSGVPGYATGGVDAGSGTGADEVQVKALSRWPNTEYYNIWVVNMINGQDGTSGTFTAGYAYFPGAPANVDGTIMLATQADAGDITLPHEIGHAFSVYHTFEGDNNGTTCPTNGNCVTDGDLVCDTDPHIRTLFTCPTNTNPCTGAPFGTVVHNFMNYSSCQDRFTQGQATRIINGLLTSRASLISSLGGTPLGATPAVTCIPTITNPSNNSNAGPRDIVISDANLTYFSVTSSGYNGDGNNVYIDNTCKQVAELTAGNSYDFSIQTGFNAEKVRVYVDYNNDGTFQASEEIYNHTGTLPNEVHSFSYTVPTTATVPGLVSCVPLRMRVVSDRAIVASVTACGPLGYGQAEDYSIVIRGGGPTTGAVSVSLTAGTNPSCIGSSLTFTATPSAGISNPTYKWYINGVYTGVTGTTFTTSAPGNGDVVKAKMFFIGGCGSDSSLSTGYVVNRQTTVPPTVSIALTAGTNPGCASQPLTFTATPTNGGANPSYQWQVNGMNAGTNSDTFTSTFNNNDAVTVILTSSSSCALPTTATSGSITVTHTTLTANTIIGITAGNNPSCEGKSLSFAVQTINGGSNPQYQWLINGNPVAGATNTTFTTTALTNGDGVSAVFTATDPCITNATDTSNIITFVVSPTDTPVVSVAITQGSNPGCIDSLVEFTATVSHMGTGVNYTWYVNGSPVSSSLVFSSTTLTNGDVVKFRAIATDGLCYTQDTVTATPIHITVNPVPAPPIISFIGNMLVANVSGTLLWYGPSGLVAGANGQSFQPTEAGPYYAVLNNGGCNSAPSNSLSISLLVGTYNLDNVSIYPNPTSGQLILDWGRQAANVSLDVYSSLGQGLLHDQVRNQSKKTLDLSRLANGVYFVVIKDETGTATVKINVQK